MNDDNMAVEGMYKDLSFCGVNRDVVTFGV